MGESPCTMAGGKGINKVFLFGSELKALNNILSLQTQSTEIHWLYIEILLCSAPHSIYQVYIS